jgi:SAM-dependent methyltransferase
VIRTIRRTVCCACGSDSRQLYREVPDGLYDTPGAWTVVQCSSSACGLLWLDPAPHPDDLILLYKDYVTHGESATWHGMKRMLRSAHRLTEDCLLTPFGIAAERRRARVMFLENQPPATLLDVGCGGGDFLNTMAARGWTVTGVDFDAEAVRGIQERLGLEAYIGTAESMAASGRKFAVVTAHHVIEHVPDPVKFLAECAKLLEVGGRVIIRTPNAAGVGLAAFGRSWLGLDPPRHLCVFTRPSLIACGKKAGLEALSCESTDANAGSILATSYFIQRDGKYQLELLSKPDILKWMIIAPLFAVRARRALRQNNHCGEELHAVFRPK